MDKMEDTFVELLTPLCEHYGANENRPLTFGNASFWMEHGALIHTPSNSEWDRESIVTDLSAFLLKQQAVKF